MIEKQLNLLEKNMLSKYQLKNKLFQITKTFEDSAKEIDMEKSTIKECKENIEYQITLLKWG